MKQSCILRPKGLKHNRPGMKKGKARPKKKKKSTSKKHNDSDSEDVSEPPSDDDGMKPSNVSQNTDSRTDEIKWIGHGDSREGGNIFYKVLV